LGLIIFLNYRKYQKPTNNQPKKGTKSMITLLENILKRNDGTYMNAQDLELIDKSLASWNFRKQAYNAIEAKETEIISMASNSMRKGTHFESSPVNKLGIDRCKRDMTMGLRLSALAMLLEDPEMFKDRILYWQQNVFLAMKLTNYMGYKHTGDAIKALLPKAQADLINPYLQMAHEMMSGK